MQSRWYYRIFGEEFGPVTTSHLRELMDSGYLSETDPARGETSLVWQRVCEISAAPVNASRAIASGSAGMPADDVAVSRNHHARRPPLWFVSVFGQILGPMPSADIQRMVAGQQLGPLDQVSTAESGPWQEICRTPSFQTSVPAPAPLAQDLSGRNRHLRLTDSSGKTRPTSPRRTAATCETSSVQDMPTPARVPGQAPVRASSAAQQLLASGKIPPHMLRKKNRVPEQTERRFSVAEYRLAGVMGLILVCLIGWQLVPLGKARGELSGADGAVVACFLEYKALGIGIPERQEWAAFTESVNGRLKPLFSVTPDETSTDPVSLAGLKLIEMASSHPIRDAARIQEAAEILTPLVGQLTGS